MISNFHTHTALCHHAEGSPSDYVASAIQSGECLALGFSDHCPYPDETWRMTRMTVEQAPGYMRDVRSAAETAPFPVYAGFECEWHPRFGGWYRDYLKRELGADYLVYGAHWVEVDGELEYIADLSDRESLYAYTKLTIQGIQSGLFLFLAHPDLPLGGGRNWDDDVEACLSDILDAAIDAGMPIEINGEGLRRPLVRDAEGTRHPYPVRCFWDMVSRRGARVICSADAHKPEYVISSARQARAYAEDMGFNPIINIMDNKQSCV